MALRLVSYLLNFPLWWDEAFVAVNLLRRDYFGLLRPLDYGQVCPLFFLWIELFVVRLVGFHEWSLRLFPLLCSIAGLILFRVVAARVLEPRQLLLAVAILAVSVHPIRHSADVKPYATDFLVALTLQGLALKWARTPQSGSWLLALGGFSVVALLLSHPAVFVIGGIVISLGWMAFNTKRLDVKVGWATYGFCVSLTYVLVFLIFTRNQASATASGMKEMWVKSFPPLDSLFGFIRWLAIAHSGDMLAYPCGGEAGLSSLSVLAFLIGLWTLVRRRDWTLLGIFIGPLGLAMVAAGLRLYPYGGPAPHGSSARIMQYAAPALCLLIGLGFSRGLDALDRFVSRDRLVRWSCLGLVVIGIAQPIAGFVRPYRAYQAEASRRFARQFWPELGRGAEVACLRWDFGAADWDSIHLGIAVSLCNQAIYSPSRIDGSPRLEKVSADHPLRCVLSVAPDRDPLRVSEWLNTMQSHYDLRSRRTILLRISEPGRHEEFESYRVFEFVPRIDLASKRGIELQSVKGL